ncbi:hypothetical protein LTR08_001358 [Meristemomyces frigidus]|nr:hypothetical protein LTR08_001358 [Meristemomyces frigidus]
MNPTTANILSGAAAKQTTKTASSRALSPARSLSQTSSQRMPSPRSSPALRPSSPLTPAGFGKPTAVNIGGMHFDSLQPPSPRQMHARPGNGQRRANYSSLKLSSLPRFHPANFPSADSSMRSTPDGLVSPQAPMSPGAHRRLLSDAQRHLFAHQREAVSAARASSPGAGNKPTSVRLVPLGSPGPVTPLELEGEGGYLFAGAPREGEESVTSSGELVDRLIREESRRQRASQSPVRTSDR